MTDTQCDSYSGSCYEVHIEHPFELETSRSCRNDRLELFNIQNAKDINMDMNAANTTAVLCGNGNINSTECRN